MFTCCCPHDEKDIYSKEKQLEQHLIETETDSNKNEQMKRLEQAQIKEMPVNINLQKMSETIQPISFGLNSSIKTIEHIQEVPLL